MIDKIQTIYRLESKVVLMWRVREVSGLESYNVYHSINSMGPYTLIGNIENKGSLNRSYFKKVVFNIFPELTPNWNNSITNYVRIAPVIFGVEQTQEDPEAIPPYSIHGLRLNKVSTPPVIAVGYNSDENRFIPLSVDPTGKLETI